MTLTVNPVFSSFEKLNSPMQAQSQTVIPTAATKVEPDQVVIGNVPETPSAAKETAEAVKAPETKEKKGPIRAIKDFIRTIKKFNTSVAEYVKGTFKGLIEGFLAGSGVFAVTSIINHFKKPVTKAIEGAKKSKVLPTKALGIITGILVLAGNLWSASLKANKKKADVDHEWTTTPIVDKK